MRIPVKQTTTPVALYCGPVSPVRTKDALRLKLTLIGFHGEERILAEGPYAGVRAHDFSILLPYACEAVFPSLNKELLGKYAFFVNVDADGNFTDPSAPGNVELLKPEIATSAIRACLKSNIAGFVDAAIHGVKLSIGLAFNGSSALKAYGTLYTAKDP